jgi:hypothetical protein
MVKNYTSSVPASRSVQHIEDALIAAGAHSIIKMCENRKLTGIAFVINVNGSDIPYRLPARIANVEKVLKSQVKRPRRGTMENISAQAERTAWKLLSDWVDIQCSLIELKQVKFPEVFLPYVYDLSSKKTFFEKIEENNFRQPTVKDWRDC